MAEHAAKKIDAQHPLYQARLPDWTLLDDVFEGQRRIKEAGATYLPPTSGMLEDGYPRPGSPGHAAYEAYKVRAVFPEYTRDSATGLLGMMHRKPAVFELPKRMEALEDLATADDDPLAMVDRKLSELQLRHGRAGVLVEFPDGASVADAMPWLAIYGAKAVINWSWSVKRNGRNQLARVVLDESTSEEQPDGSWKHAIIHRELYLDDGVYTVQMWRDRMPDGDPVQPGIAGGRLEHIPFYFLGTSDMATEPDTPPLLGLAEECLTIYRGEADHRQTLFMQGQETLVVVGASSAAGDPSDPNANGETPRVGAGARLDLPMGGDARYVGVSAAGLSEQRQTLQDDRRRAEQWVMQNIDTHSAAESGEAKRMRVSTKTATLVSMAQARGTVIRDALRDIAEAMGLNSDEVKVTANTDFTDDAANIQELVAMVDAKMRGAPITWQEIREWMVKREIVAGTWQEFIERMVEEEQQFGLGGAARSDLDPFAERDNTEQQEERGDE